MPIIRPGDRVLFKHFQLYRGENMPDIPESEWTGAVIESWGIARSFYRVKRDYDGRIIVAMQSDIERIGGKMAFTPTRKAKTVENSSSDMPVLF